MSPWAYRVAGFAVFIQAVFGALEVFLPRCALGLVFASYKGTRDSPVWIDTAQLTRNMGVYNWFLALGLLLSLTEFLSGDRATQFFLVCVALAGVFGVWSIGPKIAFFAQIALGVVPFLLMALKI